MKLKFFLIVLSLFFAVSCSDDKKSHATPDNDSEIIQNDSDDARNDDVDTADSDIASTDKLEYELFPTTHYIEKPESAGLTAYSLEGTLTFSAQSVDASKFKTNEIVIFGVSPETPHGLLRQITEIVKTEENYIVKTKDCPIQRAFKFLHFKMTKPLELGNPEIVWDVAPGTILTPSEENPFLRESGGQSFGPFTIDYYPFNGDKDPNTPEDQVHVTATMHGELYYIFGIDFDWPDDLGDVLSGDILPKITTGFYLSGGAGASLSAEGMAIRDFEREDKLAHANLDTFCIYILCFTVSVDLMTEINGSAKSNFELSAGAEASFEVGALYSTNNGGKLVPPTPKFTPQPTIAKATENADLKISVGPKVKLLLYDTLGPYAKLSVFGELSADSEREKSKCWQVNTGFDGEIGLELALFGETLAEWGDDFNIYDTTLAEGECLINPDAETPPDISDPAYQPWSMRITNSTGAWVYEDKLNLTQAIDSHWLLSGNSLKTFTKVTENGEVLFAKTYMPDDAVTPVPMSVTAAIPTSEITILATTADPIGILKLSNSGEYIWNIFPTLAAQSSRGIPSIIEVTDGFIIGGALLDENTLNNDAWIFKIDKSGKLIWSKRYGLPGVNEWVTSLMAVDDGFIATGRTFSASQNPAHQPFVIKFNNSGGIVWKKVIIGCGATESLTISKALISHDGDYILAGSFGTGTTKAVLIKIKPDGSLGWIYGFQNDTITTLGLDVKDAFQLTDGGYLLTGTIWTAGSTDYIFAARTDAVGRPTWVKRLSDGENNDSAVSALTGEGGAIVAGYSGHRNKPDDSYSSIWLSKMGVKKGELFISSLPNAVTDETVEILENPCVTISDASGELSDFAVEFTQKKIIEKSVNPVVEKLD